MHKRKLWYNRSMELPRKFDKILYGAAALVLVLFSSCAIKMWSVNTYAEGETFNAAGAKYVTLYDNGDKLTVKTDAITVGEALDRVGVILNTGDIVEPGLDAEISTENYFINIYRARPVVVKDGVVEKYLMTASYDLATIMRDAEVTVYDGDEIKMVPNNSFLESGVANVYEVTRNGGRTITVEEEIAFAEETVEDPNLEEGKTEVRQLGELGTKKVTYNSYYIDNKEVSREYASEEMVREPVTRVTAVGTKKETPSTPAAVTVTGTCADWARAAGVSEADLAAAVELMNRESGCRVNAENAYSGAYGIPQALPGSKMASAGADWQTNPVTQIRWMADYVNRYGGWQGALNFWHAHGWY